MARKDSWIGEAEESMERRGTKGAFGKATKKKIAAGIKEGGVQKKRAIFARNMKAIAMKRKRGR